MRLENKSVVVTGASAGMGRAITELFAHEGAQVIAVARRQDRLEELAEELKDAAGTVIHFVGDVTRREDNEAMINKAVDTFGKLDILVNNAGIMDDMSAIGNMSDEMFEHLLQTNTWGPVYAMRKAVQVFLEQGNGGNIINITSVGAVHNTAGVAYGMSKAALAFATKSTAFMYLDEEIRCNAIAPGGVLTEIALTMPESEPFGQARTGSLLPLATEMGMPEDIAAAALFLASDDSHFINGETITVDGGWTSF